MITLSNLRKLTTEKKDHKRSPAYKKLAPKLKDAVDDVYAQMEKRPGKVLMNFSRVMKDMTKKYKVQQKEIEAYFKKETGITL